jgi:hypothetical protein
VSINDSQTFKAMIKGLELVLNLITRYAIFEKLYLWTITGSEEDAEGKDLLAQAILKLYFAVLKYLANAKRYYGRHTVGASICPLTLCAWFDILI